ncbi:MAG: ComEA family DNA-binding protein [Microbacteriaceae bacterium]
MTAVILCLGLLVFWYFFAESSKSFWPADNSSHPSSDSLAESPIQGEAEPYFIEEELTVLVHVSGAVIRPGVYEVSDGARVIDAVERAGGLGPDAMPEGINLARVLRDAEQIHIPKVGDESLQLGSAGNGVRLININTADKETLDSLPRIGPAMAERIIRYRESNGPFRDLESMLAVSGIGPAMINDLRDKITF